MEPVIFVTDKTDEGERLGAVLRARGYAVVDVPLPQLVERAAGLTPASVICDFDPPEARVALDALRALPGGPGIHVLVLGETGKALDRHADELGPQTSGMYLRPVDAYAILRRVESLLGPPGSPRSSSVSPPSLRQAPEGLGNSPALFGPRSAPLLRESPVPATPPPEHDTRPRASEEPFRDSSWPPSAPSPSALRAAVAPPRNDTLSREKPERAAPSIARPPSMAAPPNSPQPFEAPAEGSLTDDGDDEDRAPHLDPFAARSRRSRELNRPFSPPRIPSEMGFANERSLPSALRLSQLSPELRNLLANAEDRARRLVKTPSQPPPRLSPEEEIDAVLPDEVLAALEEPLDGYDEDEELDSGPGTTGQTRGQNTSRRPRRSRAHSRERTSIGSGGNTRSSGPPQPLSAGTVARESSEPIQEHDSVPPPASLGDSGTSPGSPMVSRPRGRPSREYPAQSPSSLSARAPQYPELAQEGTTPPPRLGATYSEGQSSNPGRNLTPSTNPSLRPSPLGRFGPLPRTGWGPPSNAAPPRKAASGPPRVSNNTSPPRVPNTSPPRVPNTSPPNSEHPPDLAGVPSTSPPLTSRRTFGARWTSPVDPALPRGTTDPPRRTPVPAQTVTAPPPAPDPSQRAVNPTPPRPEVPSRVGPGDVITAVARVVRARYSGSLALETPLGVHRVVLRDGDFVTAAAGIDSESLVAFLVHRGALGSDVASGLGRVIPPFGRHAGAALVAKGHLRQDELWPVLRAHAEWLIGRMLVIDQGALSLEDETPARLKSEPVVFGGATGAGVLVELVRRVIAPEVALARLGGPKTRFQDGPAATLLAESNLRDHELAMVGRAKATSLADLLHAANSPDLTSVLYALTELGVLERMPSAVEGAPAGRATPGGASPAAPPSDEIDEAARRARVLARQALVEEGDYFALLGVGREATSYDVRRAYGELRKELTPERVLTAKNADLRDTLELILEVIEEAYGILHDPVRRERYRRALEGVPERI